jgi:hypothetical protein
VIHIAAVKLHIILHIPLLFMEKVALDVRFLTPFYFGALFLPPEQQKKSDSLCILLVYSYLCAVKKNERWTKK